MKAAATASAEQGVFSNVKQIMSWFGHCLLYSLLYISPCLEHVGLVILHGQDGVNVAVTQPLVVPSIELVNGVLNDGVGIVTKELRVVIK